MFPTKEELSLPYVPPAPPAPERDDQLLPVGIKLYTTASKSLYSVSSHIKSEDMDCVYWSMDLLRFLEYRPAEWVQYRLALFKALRIGDKLPRAPVRFVFSPKAIVEPDFKPGDLALPRCIFTKAARELCAKWRNKPKTAEYSQDLTRLRAHNQRVQDLLNNAVASGEFVWFREW